MSKTYHTFYDCPFCNKKHIRSQYFFSHLYNHHLSNLFDDSVLGKGNLGRLQSNQKVFAPFRIVLPGSLPTLSVCLGCLCSSKSSVWIGKHFESGKCRASYLQKVQETLAKLSGGSPSVSEEPLSESIPLEALKKTFLILWKKIKDWGYDEDSDLPTILPPDIFKLVSPFLEM